MFGAHDLNNSFILFGAAIPVIFNKLSLHFTNKNPYLKLNDVSKMFLKKLSTPNNVCL